MLFKLICCEIFRAEVMLLGRASPNVLDTVFIDRYYHEHPEKLTEHLQNHINNADTRYDAILLGYGLCSNGVVSLHSKNQPLVIPKAHDCNTIFLGSKEVYKDYFDAHRGVYWYNKSWLDMSTDMPGRARFERLYNEYVEKYGEDNAQYLMEMEQSWLKEYQYCSFIDWHEFDTEDAKQATKDSASYLGWTYDEIAGSSGLLKDFLWGDWDEQRFLVLKQNEEIQPSHDGGEVIKSKEKC